MQTQLTATRSELSKAREDLDKVAALPETVNLLVSQIKRLEARFDLLPPPFDPSAVEVEVEAVLLGDDDVTSTSGHASGQSADDAARKAAAEESDESDDVEDLDEATCM